MNKRIDFTHLGGFPAVQETFAWMQDSYRNAIASIAKGFGNKVIVHGCEVAGGNVSDGAVVINGELLPFIGGVYVAGDEVVVIETPEAAVTFEDNATHEVYFTKVARIGSPGGFPFTDLARINTIKEMWQAGDVKMVDCDMAYLAANFDATGLGINERKGWAVCNGQNGTRNRSGRISIGYDSADVDFVNLGDLLGAKTATILKGNLPNISLSIRDENGNLLKYGAQTIGTNSKSKIRTDVDDSFGSVGYKTEPLGNDTPMNVLNPVIVTLFIQKINA